MFFDDNVTLYTLLGGAVKLGELAIKVARNQLDYLPRADDYKEGNYKEGNYKEGNYERQKPRLDQDDYELHFANRHLRSRLRRNLREVKPRSRPRATDKQYCYDEFMSAVMAVQDNLRGHNRELHLDVEASIRRCFQPDHRKGEDIASAEARMEALVTYLNNLRSEEFVYARLKMLHSSWSVGFSPYGLSEDEINFSIHRLLMDDSNR